MAFALGVSCVSACSSSSPSTPGGAANFQATAASKDGGFRAVITDKSGLEELAIDAAFLTLDRHVIASWRGKASQQNVLGIDFYVTQAVGFADGVSFGYAGTVRGLTGSASFEVAPRGVVDVGVATVRALANGYIIIESSGTDGRVARLGLATTRGAPLLPAAEGGSSGEGAFRTMALQSPSSGDDASVYFDDGDGDDAVPCVSLIAANDADTTIHLTLNGGDIALAPAPTGGSDSTAAARSPVVHVSLLDDGISLTGDGGIALTQDAGTKLVGACVDPTASSPLCTAAELASPQGCVIASRAAQPCTLQSAASGAGGCAVAALATTGECAGGALVFSGGTGEPICLVPAVGAAACGLGALVFGGLAQLVCGGAQVPVTSDASVSPSAASSNPYQIGGYRYPAVSGAMSAAGGCRPPPPGTSGCPARIPELAIRCVASWTASQKRYARDKIADINRFRDSLRLSDVKAKESGRTNPCDTIRGDAVDRYRGSLNQKGNVVKAGDHPNPGYGYDIDHVIELQLGGIDDAANLRPLDASVNRSFGSQIDNQLSSYKSSACWGTPIDGLSAIDCN